jgi:hypothetical protein
MVPFFWRPYVREVLSAWPNEEKLHESENTEEQIIIKKQKDYIIGISKVVDYKYRLKMYENVSLYNCV